MPDAGWTEARNLCCCVLIASPDGVSIPNYYAGAHDVVVHEIGDRLRDGAPGVWFFTAILTYQNRLRRFMFWLKAKPALRWVEGMGELPRFDPRQQDPFGPNLDKPEPKQDLCITKSLLGVQESNWLGAYCATIVLRITSSTPSSLVTKD